MVSQLSASVSRSLPAGLTGQCIDRPATAAGAAVGASASLCECVCVCC